MSIMELAWFAIQETFERLSKPRGWRQYTLWLTVAIASLYLFLYLLLMLIKVIAYLVRLFKWTGNDAPARYLTNWAYDVLSSSWVVIPAAVSWALLVAIFLWHAATWLISKARGSPTSRAHNLQVCVFCRDNRSDTLVRASEDYNVFSLVACQKCQIRLKLEPIEADEVRVEVIPRSMDVPFVEDMDLP